MSNEQSMPTNRPEDLSVWVGRVSGLCVDEGLDDFSLTCFPLAAAYRADPPAFRKAPGSRRKRLASRLRGGALPSFPHPDMLKASDRVIDHVLNRVTVSVYPSDPSGALQHILPVCPTLVHTIQVPHPPHESAQREIRDTLSSSCCASVPLSPKKRKEQNPPQHLFFFFFFDFFHLRTSVIVTPTPHHTTPHRITSHRIVSCRVADIQRRCVCFLTPPLCIPLPTPTKTRKKIPSSISPPPWETAVSNHRLAT